MGIGRDGATIVDPEGGERIASGDTEGITLVWSASDGRPLARLATRDLGGVSALALNGQPLTFAHRANPHRTGAAVVVKDAFVTRLARDRNLLSVTLS